MLDKIIDPIASRIGEWSCTFTVWSVLLRVGLTLLFAAIIGWERSVKRHSAGLRTFMLIALASSASMMIDSFLLEQSLISFPILSAASIVGVAIISANTMLYTSRSQIKGLTTSVGLWTTGILGLTIGAYQYTIAIIVFIALMLCLTFFPALEVSFKNKSNHFELNLQLKNASYLKEFVTTARKLGLKIDELESNPAYVGSGISAYSVSVTISSAELKKYKSHAEIIEALASLEYVYFIEEM